MRKYKSTFGNSAIGYATCAIAHHAIVAFSGIMHPCIHFRKHAGIYCFGKIESIELPIVVARLCLGFVGIPVNQKLSHPHLFAFGPEIFVCRLYGTVLVTTKNTQFINHIIGQKSIGIIVGNTHTLGSNNGTSNYVPVIFNKCSHLGRRKAATRICNRVIGFVLYGNAIELNAIVAQVFHVIVQIMGIIFVMLHFERAHILVIAIGILCSTSYHAIGFPLGRWRPRTGKKYQAQLLG